MAKREVTANKNQTAAERAQAQLALSGRKCSKCSQDITLRDLLNVKVYDAGSNRTSIVSYHRACYGN